MTASPSVAPGGPTALHLLLTAERLFAEHGLAGVSMRHIAVAAGSANNSAVQYHFGSKDGLVEAIFTYRIGQLLQRRALLRARIAGDDVRGHVEAHALPLLELAESPDSWYVSFVEQVDRSSLPVLVLHADARRSEELFLSEMGRLLEHIPEPARSLRIRQAQAVSLHLAAQREREVRRGGEVIPFGLFVSALVDGLTGFLTAPASEETRRHIEHTPHEARRAAPTTRRKRSGTHG